MPARSSKKMTDDVLTIDIPWLRAHGYFNGFKSGGIRWGNEDSYHRPSISLVVDIMSHEPHVTLRYVQTDHWTDDKQSFEYKVRLTTTPCHFGGVRYWFICPLTRSNVPCRRRVGVLYKDGDYFGCRHCYEIAYSSQYINRSSRFYVLGKMFDADDKLEKLYDRMKTKWYRGRPTRIYRRILRLESQQGDWARIIVDQDP